MDRMVPQANAYIEKERAPQQKLSFVTGVKIIPRNLQREKYYWALEKQGKLQELARWIVQFVEPPSQEEIDRKVMEILRGEQ